MPPATPSTLHLFAVIPAEEALKLPSRQSFSVFASGPAAALFASPRPGDSGGRPGDTAVRDALRHDRIVGLALANCSSVVPFRAGLELVSTAELAAFLRLNARPLGDQLKRFRGRVEMGLKVRLKDPAADPSSLLPCGLDRVRELAPGPADRWERLGLARQPGAPGKIFNASYLISRHAVDDFWRAVDGVRRSAPELPLLGSGPWAAYSFCDVPLLRATVPLPTVSESEV
jgi:hypothetical protein